MKYCIVFLSTKCSDGFWNGVIAGKTYKGSLLEVKQQLKDEGYLDAYPPGSNNLWFINEYYSESILYGNKNLI